MNESFGKRFTDLRKAKGFTQEQVADCLGISPQAVSKWENDISFPDVTLLLTIAELLDTTVEQLLGKKVAETVMVPKMERKDIKKMLLKIAVTSNNGEKVKVNIPMGIIMACLDNGKSLPAITGNGNLMNDIDIKNIVEMVEQGIMGKLLEVESENGDIVIISVE